MCSSIMASVSSVNSYQHSTCFPMPSLTFPSCLSFLSLNSIRISFCSSSFFYSMHCYSVVSMIYAIISLSWCGWSFLHYMVVSRIVFQPSFFMSQQLAMFCWISLRRDLRPQLVKISEKMSQFPIVKSLLSTSLMVNSVQCKVIYSRNSQFSFCSS